MKARSKIKWRVDVVRIGKVPYHLVHANEILISAERKYKNVLKIKKELRCAPKN